MDFLAFWMALGAMGISVIALWFGKRQAEAAEKSADAAKTAEERASTLEEAMAFRWEVVPDGGGKFLVFNAGTAAAHDVRITLPGFMVGWQSRVMKMEPLERQTIEATLDPDHASFPGLRPMLNIAWQDRSGDTPRDRHFSTTLPENP
jgi:hypothetical protein